MFSFINSPSGPHAINVSMSSFGAFLVCFLEFLWCLVVVVVFLSIVMYLFYLRILFILPMYSIYLRRGEACKICDCPKAQLSPCSQAQS